MSEAVFRAMAGIILVAAVGVSSTFRRRADRETGERIPRSVDGKVLMNLILIGRLLVWLGPLAYILNPSWIAWSRGGLPPVLRWLGVALGILCVACVHWLFRSIGTGITPTSATRERHVLVTTGPYRWVRHPLYVLGSSLFLALGMIADSWFIAALGVATFILMAARTPMEEANLIAKFGDDYREYMRTTGRFLPRPRRWSWVLAAGLLAGPVSASAQWTRVVDLPSRDVFTAWANGDTLAAGLDTLVYVSTDGGVTWKASAPLPSGIFSVNTAIVHNGRLYAGTNRQGVFVSDDLGTTWNNYSQGLAGLGSFDIAELIVQGDSLYLATIGGGPWVRNIHSGAWTPFGSVITTFQASNMTTIAAGGSRLFAAGGFNGTVFYRDPGQPDWTLSLLFNDRFAPGLAGLSAIWTGRRWVVGSNIGIYHSETGQEPWAYVDFGIHPTLFVGFAMRGTDLFASFGAGGGTLIAMSRDDGVTWQGVDSLFSQFVYKLARVDDTLFAGRVDGLWRRSIANIPPCPVQATALVFRVAGSPETGNLVRFTFELPEAGPIAIEVFDVAGRRVGDVIRETRPAGHGETAWSASGLASGVYFVRLTAAGRRAMARLVHVR